MKQTSNSLYASLSADVSSICTLWRMTRKDGLVMGFTDFDRDLHIEGITYAASAGMVPSAIAKSSDLAVDNLDIEGMISDDRITEIDLYNGLYDFARVDIVQIDFRQKPASFTAGQVLWHVTGFLGEVENDDRKFKVEIRSLTQTLTQNHGDITTSNCSATLGDTRCKFPLVPKYGKVNNSIKDRIFTSPALANDADGLYVGGTVTFLGAPLYDTFFEVTSFAGGVVGLALPVPGGTIPNGTPFLITQGCDKSITTCQQKFANVNNFRGFPHVPGTDAWQAGTHSDGLVNIMETTYQESQRTNPQQLQDGESQYTTDPAPTGTVYGQTGNSSQDTSGASTSPQ